MTPYKGMSCFLLATILLVNCFALPDGHSDPTFEPLGIHPRDPPEGIYDPCPYGEGNTREYTLQASWCVDKKTLQRKCVQNEGDPPDIRYPLVPCGSYAYCIGSLRTDPDPRWARCEVDIKRGLRWVTNKLLGSSILQCVNIKSSTITGADGIGVSVDTTAPSGSNPAMPEEAQLFYQSALYPIQALYQTTMDDLNGFFIFNNVIDYTQALQFCVNTAFVIVFTVGFINPKPANLELFPSDMEIETVYKTFDDAAGVWKEVQLDTLE